jgi:hypothetical protein
VPSSNQPPPTGLSGTASPPTNAMPSRRPSPGSPTPPGFPFGPPTGSYAPAGPAVSGPTPGFKSFPQ